MSEARFKLEDLIGSLCSTGATSLDQVVLKEIKSLCRDNDIHCQYSYQILLNHLRKEHSEVRYSALQIIDCLFQRSHAFRELLLDEFQQFFELILEINVDNPLPPPVKKVAQLKNLAAKTIKSWHEKFADEYNLLDLGFKYLKNCKKVDFVSFSHQTVAQRSHLAKESERQQIFLNKKYLEYKQEMQDGKDDIQACVGQLERCIDILKPNDLFESADFDLPKINLSEKAANIIETEQMIAESDSETDDDDDDFEEVPCTSQKEQEEMELRYLGFLNDKGSSSARDYELEFPVDQFKIDEENKIVVEIMRDLQKELNSYLTKIKDWIKNFNSVKRGQDSLKEAIELKNMIQGVLKKFDDLHLPIAPKKADTKPRQAVKEEDSESQPGTSKSKSSDQEEKELSQFDLERKKRRDEMLKLAPVINLDEVEFCRPVTQQVETDHRFYGRSEDSRLNNNDSIAQQQQVKTTFVGEFKPVKYACRAPLKNGKLCPRMDRFKCPLHGKIIQRNEVGEIVNESDKNSVGDESAAVQPWLDTELINDINAASGKTVIEMGKKKRQRKGKLKGNLTDIMKEEDTPRKRLERRLFNKKSLNKIGSILDSIEKRLHQSKFHHQYNYSLSL